MDSTPYFSASEDEGVNETKVTRTMDSWQSDKAPVLPTASPAGSSSKGGAASLKQALASMRKSLKKLLPGGRKSGKASAKTGPEDQASSVASSFNKGASLTSPLSAPHLNAAGPEAHEISSLDGADSLFNTVESLSEYLVRDGAKEESVPHSPKTLAAPGLHHQHRQHQHRTPHSPPSSPRQRQLQGSHSSSSFTAAPHSPGASRLRFPGARRSSLDAQGQGQGTQHGRQAAPVEPAVTAVTAMAVGPSGGGALSMSGRQVTAATSTQAALLSSRVSSCSSPQLHLKRAPSEPAMHGEGNEPAGHCREAASAMQAVVVQGVAGSRRGSIDQGRRPPTASTLQTLVATSGQPHVTQGSPLAHALLGAVSSAGMQHGHHVHRGVPAAAPATSACRVAPGAGAAAAVAAYARVAARPNQPPRRSSLEALSILAAVALERSKSGNTVCHVNAAAQAVSSQTLGSGQMHAGRGRGSLDLGSGLPVAARAGVAAPERARAMRSATLDHASFRARAGWEVTGASPACAPRPSLSADEAMFDIASKAGLALAGVLPSGIAVSSSLLFRPGKAKQEQQ